MGDLLFDFQYKKTSRQLNIRKRFLALTTNERLRSERFRKLSIILMIKAKRLQGVDDARYKEISRRGKVTRARDEKSKKIKVKNSWESRGFRDGILHTI